MYLGNKLQNALIRTESRKGLGSKVGGVEESVAGNTGILHGTYISYCLPQILIRLPWRAMMGLFLFFSSSVPGPFPPVCLAFHWATREAALETGPPAPGWPLVQGAAKGVGDDVLLIDWVSWKECRNLAEGEKRRGRTASQLSLDLLLNHKCQLDITFLGEKWKRC